MVELPPAIAREIERLQLVCLADRWLTRHESYRFRCRQGHEFAWKANSLFNLQECPACRNAAKLQRIHVKAAEDGSQCLDEWLGSKALYRFRCLVDPSHEWQRTFPLIMRTARCPHCSKAKAAQNKMVANGLEALKLYAASRSGLCLSTEYQTSRDYHLWQCGRGHTWQAVFSRIRLGTWCPTCHHMSRTKPGSAAWRRYQTHQPRD